MDARIVLSRMQQSLTLVRKLWPCFHPPQEHRLAQSDEKVQNLTRLLQGEREVRMATCASIFAQNPD